MAIFNLKTVIIDNGTSMMKCGFAGDDDPSSCFPTIYSTNKRPMSMIGFTSKDFYIGDEAVSNTPIMDHHFPKKNGLIEDWD